MDTIMQSTLQPPEWRSHHRAAIRRWESESQVEEGGETRGDHQGRVHRRHQNHFQITKKHNHTQDAHKKLVLQVAFITYRIAGYFGGH